VDSDQLHSLLPRLQEELDNIEHADVKLDELQAQRDKAAQDYLTVAAQLSQNRQQAATTLQTAVSDNMQQLGMQGGVFEINLTANEAEQFSPRGMETVEFLVSANKGQPPKAMSKVASGGELSRISLAIQVITAQSTSIPTLIFDEVDVGIGGGIAEVVGRQLRSLGQHAQVLCVTHQPQVAALAHAHLVVSKDNQQDKVQTRIESLKQSERIVEVARMLGGLEITSQTLSHAKEMVERAQEY
jgi:DNA repair protein RecN (Recombination protein N)